METNTAVLSHLEAERALREKQEQQTQSQLDELDLKFYKKLHEAAADARRELELLQVKVREQESKAVYTSGAVSSFSEFIQNKYSIGKDDSVDAETGMINRV
jgi:hypothetical protein